MATRTFIGDGVSHNWSSPGAWVENSVPTSSDDVVFSSNTAGSILVIDGTSGSPSLCRSMDCTGYTRTLSNASGKVLAIGNSSGGSLTLTSGMIYSAAGEIHFVSTTTGNTITSAGQFLGTVTFNGAGGVWTLQDTLTLLNLTLASGTLNDNGKTVTVPNFFSSNTNTRALTISGTWNISFWDITDSTGMTLTATGSTLSFTGDSLLFYGGGLTYDTFVIAPTSFGAPNTIYGANTYNNLTYTSVGDGNLLDALVFGDSQTVTGTLTITGYSDVVRLFVRSDIKGTSRTLTTAANSISNADFQDIAGAGASGWNLSAITGNSGDCGGNSGITFTTPINCYMKTATSVGWDGSNWYTTSGGSTPARVPLPQDTAIFDANSITATSVEISLDLPRVSAMNWTGVLNTPELAAGQPALSFFGNITLVSGMTTSSGFGGVITFEDRGSMNFDCGGITWNLGRIVLDAPGGTLNQTSNLQIELNVTSGTWSNGIYTLGTSLTIDGGVFDLGSGSVGLGALTISAGTLEMNGNSLTVGSTPGSATFDMSGGTLNLSGQVGNYPVLDVSGGTINDTGSAGELTGDPGTFTGGTSVIRKLTLLGTYTQSASSSVKITGSATYGSWEMLGSSFTFTTSGVPTWSAGSLTIVPPGGSGGGSWTFC